MKVVHISAGDLSGGAARGAYTLHKALEKNGVATRFLTDSRETFDDPSVESVSGSVRSKLAQVARNELEKLATAPYVNKNGLPFSTGLFGGRVSGSELIEAADVVHLHWIARGLLGMRDLRRIKKPIVWTLRDMWPFTGGCHVALDCTRYRSDCGRCPQLGSHSSRDLSALVLAGKRRWLPDNLVVVGMSDWMVACANESDLFNGIKVVKVSNAINTERFAPIPKKTAREILNLPQDKKIILSGAESLASPYKGFDLLEACLPLVKREGCVTVLFGRSKNAHLNSDALSRINLGYLHDVESLRLAYCAADVFVAPYRQEAFGKTIAEALSCGTPVVCFDATGPRDLVDHRQNGYKAVPFCADDLARGVTWVLNHQCPDILGEAARSKALASFNHILVATQYETIYESLLIK